jgi:hypothetical protein
MTPPRALRPAAIALALCAAGCGYSTHSIHRAPYRTVAVPMFDNETLRREHEFDLSRAVVREILGRTPYRVADESTADLIMRGRITEYQTPALVEGRRDAVFQSAVRLALRLTVTERRTGKVVFQGSRVETARLVGARGETEGTARAEAIDRLARWAVSSLEAPW